MNIIYKCRPLSLMITCLFLIACTHENPLEKNSLSISGKFLYNASFYAEQKLNAGDAHGGQDFGFCVEEKTKYPMKYCQDLYKEILIYAKNNSSFFQNLTREDLTDANAYFQVRSYYNYHVYIRK